MGVHVADDYAATLRCEDPEVAESLEVESVFHDSIGKERVEGAEQGCYGDIRSAEGMGSTAHEEGADGKVACQMAAIWCVCIRPTVERSQASKYVKVAGASHDTRCSECYNVLTIADCYTSELAIVIESGQPADAHELVKIVTQEVSSFQRPGTGKSKPNAKA